MPSRFSGDPPGESPACIPIMVKIAELFRQCLDRLNEVANSDSISSLENEVPVHAWTDELGRFRVWAANIGAHQQGLSSLDYRLRDASHIQSQISRLLTALEESLIDLDDLTSGGSEDADGPFDEQMEELYRGFEDESNPTTQAQEIYQSVANTISHLFQMSMIIRNPTDHDRLIGIDRVDAEPFKFWARQHVSHKHPELEALIADRISTAMAKQRATLKYRERHHAKLSCGLDADKNEASTRLSETIATSFKAPVPEQANNDVMSNSGISETSYAGTLFVGENKMTIPPPPKESAGRKPFECPYCFFIITVKDTGDWARHVFRDLMPYVCLFPNCPTASKRYGSRRQWYSHIQEEHGLGKVADSHYQCPVCKKSQLAAITFNRHVGRHLEELALFVLPRTANEENELLELSEEGKFDDNSQPRSLGDADPDRDIAEVPPIDEVSSPEETTAEPDSSLTEPRLQDHTIIPSPQGKSDNNPEQKHTTLATEIPREPYSDELQRLEALKRPESDQDFQAFYSVTDARLPLYHQRSADVPVGTDEYVQYDAEDDGASSDDGSVNGPENREEEGKVEEKEGDTDEQVVGDNPSLEEDLGVITPEPEHDVPGKMPLKPVEASLPKFQRRGSAQLRHYPGTCWECDQGLLHSSVPLPRQGPSLHSASDSNEDYYRMPPPPPLKHNTTPHIIQKKPESPRLPLRKSPKRTDSEEANASSSNRLEMHPSRSVNLTELRDILPEYGYRRSSRETVIPARNRRPATRYDDSSYRRHRPVVDHLAGDDAPADKLSDEGTMVPERSGSIRDSRRSTSYQDSDASTQNSSGVDTNRPEEDSHIIMTLNGVTMSFPRESVGPKRISVRTGDTGAVELNIEGKRPRKYITGGSDYTGSVASQGLENSRHDQTDHHSDRVSRRSTRSTYTSRTY